jgi:hypothetical protein
MEVRRDAAGVLARAESIFVTGGCLNQGYHVVYPPAGFIFTVLARQVVTTRGKLSLAVLATFASSAPCAMGLTPSLA